MEDISQALGTMNLSNSSDMIFYADIGATSHITSSLYLLSNLNLYKGSNIVYMSNENTLSINQIGKTSIFISRVTKIYIITNVI